MDFTQGRVIDALNAQDTRNEELLEQVVNAADAISDTDADVTTNIAGFEAGLEADAVYSGASDSYDYYSERSTDRDLSQWQRETAVNNMNTQRGIMDERRTSFANENGMITWGGKVASLQGTGGVATLEFAKDAVQTAVSNISGIGTNQMVMRKKVEQIMARG